MDTKHKTGKVKKVCMLSRSVGNSVLVQLKKHKHAIRYQQILKEIVHENFNK